MKYTAVLNGCSGKWREKARVMQAYLAASMTAGDTGDTLWLYCDEDIKNDLVLSSPTSSVRLARLTAYQPENALDSLVKLALEDPSDIFIFPDDMFGSETAVRAAFRWNGSSLTSVRSFAVTKEGILCRKDVYANHVEAAFLLRRRPFCITIAKGTADAADIPDMPHTITGEIDMTASPADDFVEKREMAEVPSVSGLEHAKFLVVAGRGAKSKAATEKMAEIAEKLGAQFAVSRPSAMSAWAPMDRLVGVSGVVTKPDICIAAGVSGAAAFLAGIEKSKFIIAVNTDETAAITKCADAVIIDDGEEVLEEILRQYTESERDL